MSSTGRIDEGQSEMGVDELVQCILSYFDRVSVSRLHNLAFIIEAKYHAEHGERATDADYEAFLDGCFSDDIADEVESLNGIETSNIRIGGENVETIHVQGDFECDAKDPLETVINSVCREFGEVPPEEVSRKIDQIDLYRDTPMKEHIEFN
ncbi:hypothetical protein ACFR9U_16250 [Halorientalis brevis]|uniref:Uncharacterized protein n=1 Tax=Halorientalis brevis TaxID=1126241 RepID=A0ABD6CEB8_9EURY|nr:hypothetical protein [Halorientalis brevis]